MKLKGRFEKQTLEVGLSADVPIQYEGAEQKYLLADYITLQERADTALVRYEKNVLEFEFVTTTAEALGTPARVRCYRLVTTMPEEALPEVEEELRGTYEHYLALAAAQSHRRIANGNRTSALVTKNMKT